MDAELSHSDLAHTDLATDSSSLTARLTIDKMLAAGGIAGPLVFATFITIAGAAQDEYSHMSQKISELGGTEALHPWVQNLNFYLMALFVVGLAVAVHRAVDGGRGSVIGPILIGIFGFSSAGLNGVFPCDAGCEPTTVPGTLHLVTGVAGFISAIVGLVLISRRMKRSDLWRGYSRYTLATAVIGLILLVVFIVSDSGDDKPGAGLTQRAFVAPLLLWLMVTGARILRMPAAR